MKKLLFAAAILAMGSTSAFAAEIKGTIVDTMCNVKHADASEKSIACVEKCVKGGSAPVFLTSDNKILKLDEASQKMVMTHLGHKVSVTGTVDGDTLKIESIKMGM